MSIKSSKVFQVALSLFLDNLDESASAILLSILLLDNLISVLVSMPFYLDIKILFY